MTATIANSPYATTTASGSFNVHTTGMVAGTAYDDPAARFWLSGGIVSSSETIPMWGGIAVAELAPTTSTLVNGQAGPVNYPVGPILSRATQVANFASPTSGDLIGFTVFDQDYAMVSSASNPVPQQGSGGSIHFYRMGSRARINLACSASLAAIIQGNPVDTQVGWDFTYNQLVPLEASYSGSISNATYSSTTGYTTFTVGTTPVNKLAAGDPVTVSSVSPAGYNGTWQVVSVSATTIVVTGPASTLTYSSGGTAAYLAASATYLPVLILDVDAGNSMVPVYSSSTGLVTWSRTGSCATVLLY